MYVEFVGGFSVMVDLGERELLTQSLLTVNILRRLSNKTSEQLAPSVLT